MAAYSATDHTLSVNGVDLSAFMKKVSLEVEVESLDATVMGTSGTRAHVGGLKNWTVDADFLQDHTGSSVDATLFPLYTLKTAVTLIVKPTSSAVGTTNPTFTGSAILIGYQVFGSTVGDLAVAVARFQSAGALTRATT